MSTSTTIYSGWTWDEVVGSAVLATALIKKGKRAFIEFPSPQEVKSLIISGAYSIGISHREGAILRNTTAVKFFGDKKLGIIFRYDGSGRSEIIMKFANVRSVTETVLEYVLTLNEKIDVPDQLLNDIVNMNEVRLDKLSRVGKIMYKALKMNYNNKEFRREMYNFALNAIKTRSLKLPETVVREAAKFDEALRIAGRLIKEEHYVKYDTIPLLVVSTKFNDDFVRQNFSMLKPIAYDLLLKLCRSNGLGMLVLETDLGHTLRVCLHKKDLSFVKIISSIPREISEKLLISLRGNHIIIKYKNPSESSLDNVLGLVDKITSSILQSGH
ncbi:MAG: hypothetical protein J7J20_00115 [Desulfurococcales archaeon]|nr:hypothetical protein [Desulfurococcales archaeon]